MLRQQRVRAVSNTVNTLYCKPDRNPAGVIVAFSVKAPKAIESLAVGQGVPIVSSSVIYRLMDAVKDQVIKLLPVTIERRVRGEATVLEIFDIHLKAKKIMKVAGCRVSNGVVEKSKSARVVRNGDTVFEGT